MNYFRNIAIAASLVQPQDNGRKGSRYRNLIAIMVENNIHFARNKDIILKSF